MHADVVRRMKQKGKRKENPDAGAVANTDIKDSVNPNQTGKEDHKKTANHNQSANSSRPKTQQTCNQKDAEEEIKYIKVGLFGIEEACAAPFLLPTPKGHQNGMPQNR